MTRGVGGFVRDNLEAFAVAIAMALVIRHYCLEAFRIPTSSMNPTLYGDNDTGIGHHGDRILVDKYVWLRRNPRRWEVTVFQYPLNRDKNFIKRLVGLPGEWLAIADGDIWVSVDAGQTWTVQRKPADAQEQLFFPYWPSPSEDPEAFRDETCWEPGEGWSADERENRFSVNAGEAQATLEFGRRVLAYGDVDHGLATRPYVGDVRVSFEVDVERAGTLTVHLIEHARSYKLVLTKDGGRVECGGKAFDLGLSLASGRVSFANVDYTLVVDIDGTVQSFQIPDAPSQPPDPSDEKWTGKWGDHDILIEATGTKATLEDVRIERDIHYYPPQNGETRRVWRIPDGHYFMLGDNSRSSKDSREWVVEQALRTDGTLIEWELTSGRDEADNPLAERPRGGDDAWIVVEADVNGSIRRFQSGTVAGFRRNVERPFVPRDHLIGRAFAVFWPLYVPGVYSGGTRLKLIR